METSLDWKISKLPSSSYSLWYCDKTLKETDKHLEDLRNAAFGGELSKIVQCHSPCIRKKFITQLSIPKVPATGLMSRSPTSPAGLKPYVTWETLLLSSGVWDCELPHSDNSKDIGRWMETQGWTGEMLIQISQGVLLVSHFAFHTHLPLCSSPLFLWESLTFCPYSSDEGDPIYSLSWPIYILCLLATEVVSQGWTCNPSQVKEDNAPRLRLLENSCFLVCWSC